MTYTLRSACTNILWKAVNVAWISHKDCSLDHVHYTCGKGNSRVGISFVGISTTTESIVSDLTSLFKLSASSLALTVLELCSPASTQQ
jgi:hypothetical protein